MGTKLSPSVYDCHGDAMPDEPLFTLLARDPQAPKLVRQWAADRAEAVGRGEAPVTDAVKVSEAYELAQKMEVWRARRKQNNVKPVEGEHQSGFSNIQDHPAEPPDTHVGGSPGFKATHAEVARRIASGEFDTPDIFNEPRFLRNIDG